MSVIFEYIENCPEKYRAQCIEMYEIIKKAAPHSGEKISWGMPTFTTNGNLVHFAIAKNHIGLYPGVSGVEHFENQLTGYKHSKGAIQFPLDKPLPKKLITDIVKFKVKENEQD